MLAQLVVLALAAAQAEAGEVIFGCRTDDDCLEALGEGH